MLYFVNAGYTRLVMWLTYGRGVELTPIAILPCALLVAVDQRLSSSVDVTRALLFVILAYSCYDVITNAHRQLSLWWIGRGLYVSELLVKKCVRVTGRGPPLATPDA